MLAEVAGIFAANGVSIKSVSQRDANDEVSEGSGDLKTAVLTILTHRATEGSLEQVVADLNGSPSVIEVSSILRSEVSA